MRAIFCFSRAALAVAAFFSSTSLLMAVPDEGALTVSAKGPHHRVMSRATAIESPGGRVRWQTNSYTELATGMHYWRDQQWHESRAEILLIPGGAAATAGQHQVTFAAQLNAPGAIDLLTADGQRFRSTVLGLSYFDTATGNSVLIAEVKDCIGELHAPNVVLYPDAFTDVRADVRYTYTRAGFEQDIILRERPPAPATFGLDPATTHLQVLTEFFDPPVPVKTARVLGDLADEHLNFGVTHIGKGKAFSLGDAGAVHPAVPVGKTWTRLDGRDFLIESVRYPAIKDHLDALPAPQAALRRGGNGPFPNAVQTARAEPLDRGSRRKEAPTSVAGNGMSLLTSAATLLEGSEPPAGRQLSTPQLSTINLTRSLPSPRVAVKNTTAQMAQAPAQWPLSTLNFPLINSSEGFVVDYATMTTTNDFTFQSDTTYYVSDAVYLGGTNIFEGGTVIKYTNDCSVNLDYGAKAVFQTGPYRPAIFTSKDDNTVGETIGGSTGDPRHAAT